MMHVKTAEEITIMREGGRILASVIQDIAQLVQSGVTTQDLDHTAEELIRQQGAEPSFKNYQDFPGTLCVSVNDEVVHGAPSSRKLKEGDIISLDCGVLHKGFHTDMAVTVPVGEVSTEAQRLLRVTKKALKRGLKKVRADNTVGDIGNTIQRYVEDQNYEVVRDLCGHGIGKSIHEDPQIFNYGQRHKGAELKPGMTVCIEPMVAVSSSKVKKGADGFVYETEDGSLAAHFEHTVLVMQDGCEILTTLDTAPTT